MAAKKSTPATKKKRKNPQIGENNANAVLTKEQVNEIKYFLKAQVRAIHLAELYGVSQTTISFIKAGTKWKD